MRAETRSRLGSLLALSLVLSLAFGACSETSVNVQEDEVALIAVSPASTSVQVDGTAQFTATVQNAEGGTVTGKAVTWSSSNTGVATITSGGLATGVAGGTTTISATVEGVTGTAALAVQNPTPTISSIDPATAIVGDAGFTLTVNGSGFMDASVVRWGGADRPTTFVSATRLEAEISAQDVAGEGTYQVTVFNPPPGGGSSNGADFVVGVGQCVVGTVAPGETVTESLSSGDCQLESGLYVDLWELQGNAGDLIHLDLRSSEFDAYVVFADPDGELMGEDDDSGVNQNSRFTVLLETSGAHYVVVTSFAPEETGAYSLRVGSLTEVGFGDEMTGSVSTSGEIEGYGLSTTSNPQGVLLMAFHEPGTVDLGLTAYQLRLDGEPLGGDNDRVVRDGEPSGEVVMGLAEQPGWKAAELVGAGGSTGDYSLEVQECRVEQTSVGSSVSSSLASSDCTEVRGAYGIFVSFEGSSGEQVTLELSSDFDSFLLLFGPDGDLHAMDDDSGSGLDAQITETLSMSGTYIAYPTSYSAGVMGDFTLTVSSGSGTLIGAEDEGVVGLAPEKPTPGDLGYRPGSRDRAEAWREGEGRETQAPTKVSGLRWELTPGPADGIRELLEALGWSH